MRRQNYLIHYGRSKKDGAPGVGTGNWLRGGSSGKTNVHELAKLRGPHIYPDSDKRNKNAKRLEILKALAAAPFSVIPVPNPYMAVYSVSKMYSVAMDSSAKKKVDEYLKNRNSGDGNIDKKTGLRIKTKEMTSDEDTKAVNPGFKQIGNSYVHNCSLCSAVYDLRRRGYDVIAGKADYGFYTDVYKNWYKGGTVQNYTQPKKTSRARYCKDMLDDIAATQGDGARGIISVDWVLGGGGHAMAYEVENGETVLHDGQTGKNYKGRPALNLLGQTMSDIEIFRTDNLEPDIKEMKKDGVFQ